MSGSFSGELLEMDPGGTKGSYDRSGADSCPMPLLAWCCSTLRLRSVKLLILRLWSCFLSGFLWQSKFFADFNTGFLSRSVVERMPRKECSREIIGQMLLQVGQSKLFFLRPPTHLQTVFEPDWLRFSTSISSRAPSLSFVQQVLVFL